MAAGEPIQALTAAGRILDDPPYQVDAGRGFQPYRRNVDYSRGHDAPIRQLLDQLSFTKGHENWGYVFRLGAFEISRDDYRLIAKAMALKDP